MTHEEYQGALELLMGWLWAEHKLRVAAEAEVSRLKEAYGDD